MIRILQVFARLDCGGAETMLMNLYRQIDRSIIQFDFVVHTDDVCFYDEEISGYGGKIYHCPKYIGKNHREYVQWWNRFLSNHKEYKVIHSHVRSTASIYLRIAKKKGFITIAHSHSTSSGSGVDAVVKSIYQFFIRFYSDYCFACSKKAGIWLFGKRKVNSKSFFLLKNAIQIEKYIYNSDVAIKKRKELGIKENCLVMGNVGRFNKEKNHKFLISVFSEILKYGINANLLLIGTGKDLEYIKKIVRMLKIEDKVYFLEKRADVNELLQVMDIFVFPSLFEGLPVSVVEAQAAGLPCFISDKITDEIAITNLIKKIKIDGGITPWVERIRRFKPIKRKNMYQVIKNSGYDITTTSKWLTDFYKNIIEIR